jgi:hypothetical protein
MRKKFTIIENELGHDVYGCYQSHTGNMDAHYERYTKRDDPDKGLHLPELVYFKSKCTNTHESMANNIFTRHFSKYFWPYTARTSSGS